MITTGLPLKERGTVGKIEVENNDLVTLLRPSVVAVQQLSFAVRRQLPDSIKFGRSISPIYKTGCLQLGHCRMPCLMASRERLGRRQVDLSPLENQRNMLFRHLFLEYDGRGDLSQLAIEHAAGSNEWLLKTDVMLQGNKIVLVKQTVTDNTYFDNPQCGPFWRAYKRFERLEKQGRLGLEEEVKYETMKRLIAELRQRFVASIDLQTGGFKLQVGTLLSNRDLVSNKSLEGGYDRFMLAEAIERITRFQPAIEKR